MSALRTLDRATGLHGGDHACWAYSSRRAFVAAAVASLREGVRRGERLLYVGSADTEVLTADLDGLDDRDALLAEGRLTLHHLDGLYGPPGVPVTEDPVAVFRRTALEAEARGFPGLRAVADVTALAECPDHLRRMAAYELRVDAMIAAHDIVGVCGYDERRVGEEVGVLAALHPLQHRTTRAASFAVALRDGVLDVTGEVDATSAGDLRSVLEAVQDVTGGPLVLDLHGLDFIDVAGARALARAEARVVDSGRPTGVRGARASVRRCLELFGLSSGDGEVA